MTHPCPKKIHFISLLCKKIEKLLTLILKKGRIKFNEFY
jgi:hypothetical protein